MSVRCGAMIALACVITGCATQKARQGASQQEASQQTQSLRQAATPSPSDSSAVAVPTQPASPKADRTTERGAMEQVASEPKALALRAFLPHVRLDAGARVVEFDGVVPINAHDERAPNVYLEVLACGRDTREHEALVVTDARPSQVHAALLAIGLEPGKPGSYSWQGQQVQGNAPTGPRVRVEVIAGSSAPALLTDWAVNAKSGETLSQALSATGDAMVFAGSVSVDRNGTVNYLGDGAGTLVGLSTFGTETIACQRLFNPDSAVEEPVWIANANLVPNAGTPVRVRITVE